MGANRRHPLWIEQRPLEHLHAAQRAAEHQLQPADAETLKQGVLSADDVADGDGREVRSPEGGRTRGAVAAPEHIACRR